MSEKREDSRRKNDELWDKKFSDDQDVDSTGHLSRTERRKKESHSSTITTILIVLIIVLAATPLIYWFNNKQSFNHPARTEQTATVSSKKKHSQHVKSTSSRSASKKSSYSSNAYTSSRSYSTASSSSQYSQTKSRQQSGRKYVTVQRGETMYRIAARNGITVSQLAKLNNISTNSQIRAGQELRVR